MNEIEKLRKKQINDFMSKFDDLNNVDRNILEEGIRGIIKETPGIDFEYDAEHFLNEDTGKEDRVVNLKNIHIYFSYIEENVNKPRIGKITYVVS